MKPNAQKGNRHGIQKEDREKESITCSKWAMCRLQHEKLRRRSNLILSHMKYFIGYIRITRSSNSLRSLAAYPPGPRHSQLRNSRLGKCKEETTQVSKQLKFLYKNSCSLKINFNSFESCAVLSFHLPWGYGFLHQKCALASRLHSCDGGTVAYLLKTNSKVKMSNYWTCYSYSGITCQKHPRHEISLCTNYSAPSGLWALCKVFPLGVSACIRPCVCLCDNLKDAEWLKYIFPVSPPWKMRFWHVRPVWLVCPSRHEHPHVRHVLERFMAFRPSVFWRGVYCLYVKGGPQKAFHNCSGTDR